MNDEYINTNLHVTKIHQLKPVNVGLSDGRIIDGSFEVIGENNQGQLIAVEYNIPGKIQLQRGPSGSSHKPQRRITKAEWEQWQKDHTFVFKI